MNKRNSKSKEDEAHSSSANYESNSFSSQGGILDSLFECGLYDYFSKEQIKDVLRNPINNHDAAIRLSNFVYTKNGVVSNSIDYMTALMCLDSVVTGNSTSRFKIGKDRFKRNKSLMKSTLKTIDDKRFIRDALHTEMTNGIAFYYFETRKKANDKSSYMTDYDVGQISEINDSFENAAIITLPWRYTKIVGKKNGRYVLAFNLRYFKDFTGDTLERKLRKYPQEIVKGYHKWDKTSTDGDWLILDNDRTMARKIKCKDTEPWGRSLIIAALEDVLYSDYFTDTKRNVLDELNNRIIFQTFPEGKEKGMCALTKPQQENQHKTVKEAVLTKNSRGGVSFFSVAAGTKLESIDVSTDIFDEKNEAHLNDKISLDLGVCASLIGAMSTGNFAAGKNNLEMITAQLYTWVTEWKTELNHVINANIIKDKNNRVEVYYFPTSFVNKDKFFDQMKSLYTDAGGSFTFLVASTGIDPDAYMSVLDAEIEDGIFERYLPHATSWTTPGDADKGGRPEETSPTNENTIASKSNSSNELPSPSD